jgi:hypothetical protein
MDNKEAIERLEVIMVGNSNSKLNQALSHAIDVMKASEVSNDWQPIETAPMEGSFVLLTGGKFCSNWEKNQPKPDFVIGRWENDPRWEGDWIIYYDLTGCGRYYDPTHWMPLPQPPKEGE